MPGVWSRARPLGLRTQQSQQGTQGTHAARVTPLLLRVKSRVRAVWLVARIARLYLLWRMIFWRLFFVSNAGIPQNRYKADLREMRFLLFEQFHLGELLGQAPFEAGVPARSASFLTRFTSLRARSSGLLNAVGDREGCRIEGGWLRRQRVSSTHGKAVRSGMEVPRRFDRPWWTRRSPGPLRSGRGKLLSGANTAFNMYACLAYGAA